MENRNRIMRTAGLLLAAVVIVCAAGVAVSAFSGWTKNLVYEKRDYAVNAAGLEQIRIRARNMPVKVTASGSEEIVIHYFTCDEDPYEVSLEGGALTLAYKKETLTNYSTSSDPRVDLILPAAYAGDLLLESSNAQVNMSGLTAAGEVRIDTSNAPIEVNSVVAAFFSAHTSNGAVTLDKLAVSGTADARSSNGGITARETVAKDGLYLETSNGRVTVDRVASADIRLRSSNGAITGGVEGKRADYTISSHTSNGDDSLGDGGKGQFRLTVQTSNGNIGIRFLGE